MAISEERLQKLQDYAETEHNGEVIQLITEIRRLTEQLRVARKALQDLANEALDGNDASVLYHKAKLAKRALALMEEK